ncbi:unnamed protein product [Paramecium sonneborni]|uniref:Uncharacterized protein n=1 Tax=Paramecium sonneborni TaxID=65129 RepID=A0A8S1RTK2_9CILI|nr:unnamed protein product [Paramecium sonneborni]
MQICLKLKCQSKKINKRKKFIIKFVSFNQYRELYNKSKVVNEQLWEKLRKVCYSCLIQRRLHYNRGLLGKVNLQKCLRLQINQQRNFVQQKVFKTKNSETDRIALVKVMTIMRKINHKDLIQIHEVYEGKYFRIQTQQSNQLLKRLKTINLMSGFLIQSKDTMKSQQIMINNFQQYHLKRESDVIKIFKKSLKNRKCFGIRIQNTIIERH